jgi:hypothetical protein
VCSSDLEQLFQILKWLIKRCSKFDEVTFSRIFGLFEKIVALYRPEDDDLVYCVRLLLAFPTEIVADNFSRICIVCFDRFEIFLRKVYCPILKRAKTFDSSTIVKSLNCSGYFSILQNAMESGTSENLRYFTPTLKFIFPVNSAVQKFCRELLHTFLQRADWSAQFLIPILLPCLSESEFEQVMVWMMTTNCGELFPVLTEFVRSHGLKSLNVSADAIVEAVNRAADVTGWVQFLKELTDEQFRVNLRDSIKAFMSRARLLSRVYRTAVVFLGLIKTEDELNDFYAGIILKCQFDDDSAFEALYSALVDTFHGLGEWAMLFFSYAVNWKVGVVRKELPGLIEKVGMLEPIVATLVEIVATWTESEAPPEYEVAILNVIAEHGNATRVVEMLRSKTSREQRQAIRRSLRDDSIVLRGD